MIHRAREEMLERYRAVDEDGVSASSFPPITLLINDIAAIRAEMFHRVGDAHTTWLEVYSVIRKGHDVRVHVVVSVDPNLSALCEADWSRLRDQLGMKLSIGPLDPAAAQMIWGTPTAATTPVGPRARNSRPAAPGQHDVPG